MGLLDRVMGLDARTADDDGLFANPGVGSDFYFEDVGSIALSGEKITPEAAKSISAVFGCVRVLATHAGFLPIHFFDRGEDDRKSRVRDYQPARLFAHPWGAPNQWQSVVEFKEMFQGHAALRGNAFAEIIPTDAGFAGELVPLHPDHVRPIGQTRAGKVLYGHRDEQGREREIPQEFMFHLRTTPDDDGVMGMSPIRYGAETLGLARATERHGSTFFRNRSDPGGVVSTEGELSDAAYKRIRDQWRRTHRGPNRAHEVAILEGGLKWERVGLSNEDSQFLETQEFTVEQIARFYGVPLRFIQAGKDAKLGSVEADGIDLLRSALMPWFARWEARISISLIEPQLRETRFAEFVPAAILRGDTKTRYETYAIGIQNGFLGRQQIEKWENLPPQDDAIPMPVGAGSPNAPAGAAPPDDDEPETVAVSPGALLTAHRAAVVVEGFAENLVRKETNAIRKLAERHGGDDTAFAAALGEFFEKHGRLVAKTLNLNDATAKRYARERCDAWKSETFERDGVAALVQLSIGGSDV